MKCPKVSIITPTYNSEKYVAETIESIISQTYDNWELLVTDDCSTDSTVRIVEEYSKKDDRIKLFTLEKNSGGGVARNNSIEKAAGRFIAFCDSDDRWYSNKLEKQISFMLEKGCALSYTSYITCNEQGVNEGIIVCRKKETFKTTRRDDKIGCLTAIYDVAQIGKIYLPLIRKRQDWGLMLKILQKCECAYGMKEPLAIYRIHNNSISSNKKSLIRYNIALYREVLGWSLYKATIFFCLIYVPCYLSKKILVLLYNK